MRPAVSYLTNLRRYILNLTTVNRDVGTGFGGKLQLVIVNIDGNNLGTENLLGVLHRQVAQPASTVGDQPLTGAYLRFLNRLIGGHARAGNRACLCRIQTFGNLHGIVCRDKGILTHGTVHSVARILDGTA